MTISENGKEPCPSIHVHHGLMDGSHLGTICRLFSRNHESIKNTAENTLLVKTLINLKYLF
jgi:hypothetical protein